VPLGAVSLHSNHMQRLWRFPEVFVGRLGVDNGASTPLGGSRGLGSPPRVIPTATSPPLLRADRISVGWTSGPVERWNGGTVERWASGRGNPFQGRCDFLRNNRIWPGRVPTAKRILSGDGTPSGGGSRRPARAGPGRHAGLPILPILSCSFNRVFRGANQLAYSPPERRYSASAWDWRAGRARARGYRNYGRDVFAPMSELDGKQNGVAC
jgi:hypothetical protein